MPGFAFLLNLITGTVAVIHGTTMGENPCRGGNDTVLCESIAFAFTQCAVSEGKIIITAWVAVQHSMSSCNYQNGSGESYSGSGAYGYTPSAVWVAAGCRATFVMCTDFTTNTTTASTTLTTRTMTNTTVTASPTKTSTTPTTTSTAPTATTTAPTTAAATQATETITHTAQTTLPTTTTNTHITTTTTPSTAMIRTSTSLTRTTPQLTITAAVTPQTGEQNESVSDSNTDAVIAGATVGGMACLAAIAAAAYRVFGGTVAQKVFPSRGER